LSLHPLFEIARARAESRGHDEKRVIDHGRVGWNALPSRLSKSCNCCGRRSDWSELRIGDLGSRVGA
jgi:hypothetical protein